MPSGVTGNHSQSPVPGEVQGCTRAVAHDADEHARHLERWNQTYEQLAPGAFVGTLVQIAFDDVQLFRETANRSLHQGGLPWPAARAFGIPVSIDEGARYCGRTITPGSLLTLGGGEELDLLTPRSMDLVGLAVDARSLADYARSVEEVDVEHMLAGRRALPVCAQALDGLRSYALGAFESFERDRFAALASPANRRTLRDGLLQRLLATLASGGAEPAAPPGYAMRKQVVEAVRRIALESRDTGDTPLTVGELCARVGVSRRTLQYCFAEVLDTSPVQYLRAIRLAGVRRALRAPDAASVQDEAAAWGFWHLSRFAADYRKMFGELPSETLRAKRSMREPIC